MLILKNLRDIAQNDPFMEELIGLAERFGLNDLEEIPLLVYDLSEMKKTKAFVSVTEENVSEVIAKLLALTIINYGVTKHEEFAIEVLVDGELQPIRFFRNGTIESFQDSVDNNMQQIRVLMKAYFSEDEE